MDTLQSELVELKKFIAELKSDRATQKDKEKREAWTKYTSLSIVFIAVLAAVATQWSGKYSSRVLVALNDATFDQAKASDQWSYYQAKSIKQNLFEVARDQLPKASEAPDAAAARPLDGFNAKIAKYEQDKNQIQADAKKLEEQRDHARQAAVIASQQGSRMGLAVSIFQISIAMGSICLVVKKKPLWYLALLLAGLAAAEMARVWML
jgi:hypothetical protein